MHKACDDKAASVVRQHQLMSTYQLLEIEFSTVKMLAGS